ncbi:unnamed protein product [Mytilus coruscus]|uniref:RNA-directed DNA polymerase n=1 Tax=Mytilus coruscus TaxID=42192 RepID=A0A6J8D4R8_MYTCO|nr:unnamed protein product [Mytilus coruscus]
MQLGPTQEIEDFSCQVLEKGQILAKPEHEIMFRFINGLPEKLAFYVRTSHPKTQSEALSFAKAGEAYKYRIHEQCAAVGKGPSFRNAQSEDISEMKSQIYELTSMMKKLTPDKAFQQSDQRQSSGCYKCSCTGHAKRYCNWNGSGTISAEISCQLCNQSGHGAGQCLKFKAKTDNYNRNRVVCQICSKPNHTASECYHNQFAQQGNPNFLGDIRHGPSGSFSENSSYSDNDTSEFYSDNENFSIAQTDSKFIYLHVKFHSVQVAALLDSGSSINIMSTSLYNSIPQACKSMIDVNNGDNIKFNDQNVQVKGTATVKMYYKGDKHCLQVYILEQTSHPFILGTSYLKDNKITIDFGESEVVQKHANIRCRKRITLDPHSEIIIWGRLPRNIHFGYQGMCESSTQILSHGLISSKAVVTVSQDRTVPVKILNPGSNSVVIPKGKIIAKFSQLTEEYQVRHVNCTNNVPVLNKGDSIDCEFLENFEINPTLKDDQKIALNHLLCDNKEVFVTTDRPNLGCTDIAQHHIILKPDMRPLHQKPYRLTPHKKEVLRHHLDELLQQGVICELNATEEVPITSPVVLVAKRSKPSSEQISEKTTSLRQFRFCVDFRYLNTQTEPLKSFIPDIQELTESFTERIPNYIASIDMRLKLNPQKCTFANSSAIFLGHHISKEGIRPPPDRVRALNEFPPPQNVKQLRRALAVDSSATGIGYMLYQKHPSDTGEQIRVVRFGSKSLNSWQKSYGPTKLELLGVVTSIVDCASYLRGDRFTVECDHQALRSLFQNQFKEQFTIDVEEVGKISFVNFAKLSTDEIETGYTADTEEESSKLTFKQESIDGHSTLPCNSMTLADSGITSIYPDDNRTTNENDSLFIESSCDVDSSDNNSFFYRGTRRILFDVCGNECVSDCACDTLFVNKYENETDNLRIDDLTHILQRHPIDFIDSGGPECDQTSDSLYLHVHNSGFDTEFTKVQDIKFVGTADKSRDQPIDFKRENIKHLQRLDETLLPVILYLENGTLPKLQKEARRLLLKAPDYSMIDDLLFHSRVAKSKRTQRMGEFQLVIPKQLIPKVLETYHQTPLSVHMGIQQTVDNISEQFYFQNLPSTVSSYVRSCHDCQERKMTKAHTKSEIISFRTPTEPFQTWQVDLFGPLPITQKGTHIFSQQLICFPNYYFVFRYSVQTQLQCHMHFFN